MHKQVQYEKSLKICIVIFMTIKQILALIQLLEAYAVTYSNDVGLFIVMHTKMQ